MLSSISNSDPSGSESRAATRAFAALLTGLVLWGAGLETAARIGFSRVSRIRRRVERDLRDARSMRPRAADGAPTLLFVGNSLLLLGVDRDGLRRHLSPAYEAVVFPVENTQYEDWYFGLRRLFAEGSRPAVVAAAFTPRQLLSPATNGEHFARLLMRPGDLLAVQRESGLDNTAASAYFFANRSEWLGARGQIRNWLFFRLFPALEPVAALFPGARPPMPSPRRVAEDVLPRLLALDRLCRENGAEFRLIVPPTLDESAGAAELQEAAARAGVKVLVPMRPGELLAEEFSDGFHLNPRGAARFTPRVGEALLRSLGGGEAPAAPEALARDEKGAAR